MSSVAKKMRNVHLNRLIHNLRTRFGNRVIYKKGALPEMMQVLRQGGMVAILMDISRRFEGVEVHFFGRRATATPAAALLGLRCKSPVIPAFCHRDTKGKLVVQVTPPVELQRTNDLTVSVDECPVVANAMNKARRAAGWLRIRCAGHVIGCHHGGARI